jgi:beta-N-acetylhexosaminidase
MKLKIFLACLLQVSICWLGLPAESSAQRQKKKEDNWARQTLARMTLKEKIGQMILVDSLSAFVGDQANRDAVRERALRMVMDYKVGFFLIGNGTVADSIDFTNRLQGVSTVPLIFTADFEQGAGCQFRGATHFPSNMALGATRSEALAYSAGEVTAREGRALGIQWIFAPVVDVSSNPDNPIVNIRSYGEDPALVSRMGTSVIRGVQAGGQIATAKHFPGGGDTTTDSHIDLAVIRKDKADFERIDLEPFRQATRAKVGAVMTAHIAVPALEHNERVSATLSPTIITGLLRQKMGFDGLVITDAMAMGGVINVVGAVEASLLAIKAGADVLLGPQEIDKLVPTLIAAVEKGEITEQRIDTSVLRILQAKERFNLHRDRMVSLEKFEAVLAETRGPDTARQIAERSLTLLKGQEFLPLNRDASRRVLSVYVTEGKLYNSANENVVGGEFFQQELKTRFPATEFFELQPQTEDTDFKNILERAKASDLIFLSLATRVVARQGTVGIAGRRAEFIRQLLALKKPLVFTSFGNPYLLRQFPDTPTYVCAYSNSEFSQRAAVRAYFGEIPFTGKLPVSIPGYFKRGDGTAFGPKGKSRRSSRKN